MRVGLYADFSRFTGYGNDAVDLALALDKAGVDVLPLPRNLTPGLDRRFLRLLEKDPLHRPDVVVVYTEPTSLDPARFAPFRRPVVVWTMWERTPYVPADPSRPEWFDLGWVKELVVSCPMNVAAFRDAYGGVDAHVIPAGLDVSRWPQRQNDRRPGPTRFLLSGILSERKNPFALLDAWRDVKAAGMEGELTLHSTGRNLHPKIVDAYGPDLRIIPDRLSHQDLVGLYLDHDVYVAPARGEGNNKPAMEFAATGGLVLASDWGGHQNWLHRDYAVPLPGTLVECPYQAGTEWFEVDPDGLRAALHDAATMPQGQRYRMGQVAASRVRGMTWDDAARRLMGVVSRGLAATA